jgi:precorrin isomerase
VGYVRQAGREEQMVKLTTLGAFDPEDIDMFTVILIGNSQTYISDGKIITPRGYSLTSHLSPLTSDKPGQQIMMESFRTIKGELRRQDYPLDHLWTLLHAIHTTADFDMEDILYTDEGAVETIYNKVREGSLKTIVTDVTMVTSGIRKGALQRLGIEAKCYLSDPRVAEMTAQQPLTSHPSPLTSEGITRTQAGIRLAVEEHPDALFAFGNAPTALMELCDLIRKGKAHPAGIIAAPVGFVHVKESKHMVKPFKDIPKIIVEGRKGGSNLAATLCNAILTFDDAAQLKPGRDL